MPEKPEWWLLVPAPIRQLPADLAAVVILVLLTVVAVITPGIRETPLRVLFGLPFILFIPGYALIAALFPEASEGSIEDVSADEATDQTLETEDRDGIDGIERVALSFGLSIAVVPLIGLILNFTPFGIRLIPILVSVAGFSLAMTALAAHRRWELPEDERFEVPYRAWLAATRDEFTNPDSQADQVLNVLLVLSIVLAVASVGYAVAVPKQGESFTEFYILTQGDDGGLVADNYPTEFTVGETRPLTVGIGNREHQDMEYTIVIQLQDVHIQNNSTTVLEQTELHRLSTPVAANETWHRQVNITPSMTGDRLRLILLLYIEAPPPQPTVENSYRETHLWINVSAANEAIQQPSVRDSSRSVVSVE